MRLMLFAGLVTILWACAPSDKKATSQPSVAVDGTPHVYDAGLKNFKPVPEAYLDTFSAWKQLFYHTDLDQPLQEEELKDKLEMMSALLRKINFRPYPERYDNPAVKSRMLLLETDVRQLQWILENEYRRPAPDSIFRRLGLHFARLNDLLIRQAENIGNFEEIFEAKRLRDERLRQDSLRFVRESENLPPVMRRRRDTLLRLSPPIR